MKPSQTPHFQFTRSGTNIHCWFSPSPLKKDGQIQSLAFIHSCESEMEAVLLLSYLDEFYWLMKKEAFTDGYNTHKRRESNYML